MANVILMFQSRTGSPGHLANGRTTPHHGNFSSFNPERAPQAI